MRNKKKGFTLLEILISVAIISILAALMITMINPTSQLAKTRNIDRKADVSVLYQALYQYWLDEGDLPATVSTTPTMVCKSSAESCSWLVDLSVLTEPPYVVALPSDPTCETENSTGYSVHRSASSWGFVIVQATCAEDGQEIYSPREWSGSSLSSGTTVFVVTSNGSDPSYDS